MPGKAPPTMRAWQYSGTKGGLEKNLHLNTSAPIPRPGPEQYLVQVLTTALNPIDYKPAEVPLINRLLIRKPATPGIDFAGYLVKAPAGSTLKRGQLVFGATGTNPMAGGALAEFAITQKNQLVALPDALDATSAATLGVASLTAYQTIVPHVKPGDKVFINGGSGGTGVFGIQIAKAVGCYVTTTCSGANAELCRSLGADEVIEYRRHNVVDALKASGHRYDHVVDNIGNNKELYWRCHEFTKPNAIYIFVGDELSLANIWDNIKRKFWPAFLGGGQRKVTGHFTQAKSEQLEQVAAWIKEGKVRTVIDQKFPFDQAPRAVERLKSKRARGKIVVEVSSEPLKNVWAEV